MTKRSRTWRPIVVDDIAYRWRFGRGTIEVRRENTVVLRIGAAALAGIDPNLFARAQYKRTQGAMITPRMVEDAVRRAVAPRYAATPREPRLPCPVGAGGRHRWRPPSEVAPHALGLRGRICKYCGATARIDGQGRAVCVEGVPLNRLEASGRSLE